MSRLGKQPIAIPNGVTVTADGGTLTVTGAKGTNSRPFNDKHVVIEVSDGQVTLTPQKTEEAKALWGTYAAHLRNMIKGVSEGFEKILELEGVGYRAELKGKDLVLNVGFSHPVVMTLPEGVEGSIEKNAITLKSHDLEVLGQFAANVRKVRPPEPYKGKGIRYRGEYIIRKQGKKAA